MFMENFLPALIISVLFAIFFIAVFRRKTAGPFFWGFFSVTLAGLSVLLYIHFGR